MLLLADRPLLSRYVLVGVLLAMAREEQLPANHTKGKMQFFSINCDPHLDSSCDSPSLEQVLTTLDNDNVHITINIAQLQLKANVTFFQLESLTVSGNPNVSTNICITCPVSNAGLVFSNISNLTLTDLTISHCGFIVQSKNTTYSSAVTIIQCRDVMVNNLVISNSVGIGLIILNHQGGLVQIESSHFVENIFTPDDSMHNNISGGGGVYVGNFERDPSIPVTFRFDNCIFKRNIAHTKCFDYLYTDDLGEPVSGHGRGGGAAILLGRDLTDIHVTFSGCTFTHNEGFLGGGLASEIGAHRDSETRNVTVKVEGSLFEENGCSSSNPTASGGGMHINFATYNSTLVNSNQFVIHNVTFKRNCAQFGGGLYFYSYYESNSDQSNIVIIEESTFNGNRGHTGSAVDITPNVFQRLSSGILTTPVFRNCIFSNNIATHDNTFQKDVTQTTYGVGTVYISLYNVRFEGYNSFNNNSGTAIHIVNGNINMSQSSVNFYHNHGLQGGAVALIGQSSLIVGSNKTYEFVKNRAIEKGGALYVQAIDSHDITASKTCFIQYYDRSAYIPDREWTANITFIGNRANAGTGHTIFSTSLYSCQTINDGSVDIPHRKSISASEVFTVRGINIEENQILRDPQIATEGALLHYNYNKGYPMEVIPGEQFAHGVTITDDLDNQAKVVLTATIRNNPNVKLDAAFSSCVGKQIVLRGKQGEAADLYLQTTTSRLSYIRLKVKLVHCPPGFIFSETSSGCICNSHEYVGMLTCNTTVFHSYITPGFWVGLLNDIKNKSRTELVTSYCPMTFCNYNGTSIDELAVQLPRKHSRLNEAMCGMSRTGVACGSCASGYTTHYHSPNYECKPVDYNLCKVGWLFYILSELVPVTVVFITVLTLNISFTSGAVNGFVLFSQLLSSLLIDASGIIKFPPAITKLTVGYRLIYGFFNLDFFRIESLSFCLLSNASALDMLAFKYVTIVYALFLVMIVIWFMNKCGGKCLGRWCRITTIKSSVIHGISAFLILCYSQCVRISLNLLNTYPLFVRENSNLTVSKRVWLNGNIDYFSRSHLSYALPALLCLLIIGVPFLLLAYPLLNKVLAFFGFEESKLVNLFCQKLRISSLKPLLDSFQGCFKDNLRFFAGLYFVYRWIALILTITLSNFDKVYTAVEFFIIVILVLHALCQPYASKIHNMVDTLLFGNLALINALSFAHYYIFRTRAGRQVAVDYIIASAAIQLVLIYLPLLIMAVYVVMLICKFDFRKKHQKNAGWTASISLVRLRNSFSKENSIDDEELPHRLIAGKVDYECFEDNDRIL